MSNMPAAPSLGNHPAVPSILAFLQSLSPDSPELTSRELHAAYLAFPGARPIGGVSFGIYASRTVGTLLGSRRRGTIGTVYWRK